MNSASGDQPQTVLPITESPNHPATSGAEEERALERVGYPPTAEEVAERVYQLLCQELRIERERQGAWQD